MNTNNSSASMLDKSDLPAFAKDTNGRYTYCNKAFADLLGMSINSIINRTIFEIVNENIATKIAHIEASLLVSELKANNGQLNDPLRPSEEARVRFTMHETVTRNAKHQINGLAGVLELNKSLNAINYPSTVPAKLTDREAEILQLLAKGLTAKRIATTLNISPHTVSDHKKSIFQKLNAHTIGEAVFKSVQLNLLINSST